jgi:nitrite reductase (NO-forming)
MFDRVREWYIAAIGFVLIGGGLYFAAQHVSDGGAKNDETKQAANISSTAEAKKAPSAANGLNVQPSRSAEAVPATIAPSALAAPAAPAALPAEAQDTAPAAHDQAANAPRPNIAQAPAPTPAPASRSGPNTAATSVPIGSGDPIAGKLVFRKCQVCHSLEPRKDVLGPSLAGIVGRKSGAEPNYAY